jgi:hypothetical protein
MSEGTNKIFESYISKDQWQYTSKVSVKYKESKWLKWIDLFNTKWYRRYYLKVIYKDGTIKHIPIPIHVKEELKSKVIFFNCYLSDL